LTSGENLFYFRHGAVGTCVRRREEASPCRNGLRRRELARRSQAAVTAKDREAWLSLFASDAVELTGNPVRVRR